MQQPVGFSLLFLWQHKEQANTPTMPYHPEILLDTSPEFKLQRAALQDERAPVSWIDYTRSTSPSSLLQKISEATQHQTDHPTVPHHLPSTQLR